MKLDSDVLKCFVYLRRNSPYHGKVFRDFLEKEFRIQLKKMLAETATNDKMMLSGRVQQLDDLIKQYDEAEDILLRRENAGALNGVQF